jgi:pyridoxamine 5'-phosphate oxidase
MKIRNGKMIAWRVYMDGTRKVIRQSKTLKGPFPGFNISAVPELPYQLFLEWFQVAIDNGVHEPHAMTLSTTDENGDPDARVLIIKDVDENGWYFASSSLSEKGKQLEINPNAAMTFYWSPIGRQIRIRGQAIKLDKKMSAEDFLNRGTVARAIALLGKQSLILKGEHEFEEALARQLEILEQDLTIVYPSWTLYRLAPKEVEFWQANQNRKHKRLKYMLDGDKWIKNLLWP